MSTVISKSVGRAFALLELFARERRPLTATDIESALHLPQASALVLARELAELGYLTFDTDSRSYFPSQRLPELTAWLAGANLPVRRLREVADEIARATQETTSICTRNGRYLQIEHFVLGTLPGSVLMHIGRAAPLPCSGAGRAVLATLDDVEVNEIVESVAKRDPQHRFNPESAFSDVKSARKKGYLATFDLMIAGVSAVAFPLPREATGGNFAVVVAAPSPRVKASEGRVVRICREILARRFENAAGERPGAARRRRTS